MKGSTRQYYIDEDDVPVVRGLSADRIRRPASPKNPTDVMIRRSTFTQWKALPASASR